MNELYRFSAERQLIFYVVVNGLSRLIQFGERSLAGASNFLTNDEKIANAIRKTSLFRRGVIKENTVFPAEKAIPETKDVKPAGEATFTTAGTKTRKAKTATPKQEAPVAVETTETEADTTGKEVLEVKNFTQAKEAVCKRLNLSKKFVKTPQMLAQVAQEAGITIKYLE